MRVRKSSCEGSSFSIAIYGRGISRPSFWWKLGLRRWALISFWAARLLWIDCRVVFERNEFRGSCDGSCGASYLAGDHVEERLVDDFLFHSLCTLLVWIRVLT
jgi:hypothetical protein